MKEKIQFFLEQDGFKKLSATYSGIDIFFTIENGYVNAILLGNLTNQDMLFSGDFEQLCKKTQWRFLDGGCTDVHMLCVILTEDVDKARMLCLKESFAWFIDVNTKRLIVDENKAEDFYGMRSKLELWANMEYDPKQRSGLYNRVYDVKGRPFYSSFLERSIVNHSFFVINVLVFTCCILLGNVIYPYGNLQYQAVFEDGQWYRILTSMFLHADMTHLTGNMLILYYMGDMVERAMGHVKYFVLYMASGILAAFASLFFAGLTGDFTPSIGASGAIFGMIGALLWIAIRNHGKYAIFNVRKILFLIGYSIFSGLVSTGVDNAAHVGGVISGFFLAILLYRLQKKK